MNETDNGQGGNQYASSLLASISNAAVALEESISYGKFHFAANNGLLG